MDRRAVNLAPVTRSRLLRRLEEAAAFPVAVILGPAGYGKSVLLRQFGESLGPALLVRYDVRAEHATLGAFVRGLAEATQTLIPGLQRSLSGALDKVAQSKTPAADLAAWAVAHLTGAGITIVIDDFHIANDPAVSVFLERLIERTNNKTHWIISSRDQLDLPVESWMAYGTAGLSIAHDELALTYDEAIAIAEQTQAPFTTDEVRALFEFTGGWPTAFAFALRSSTKLQTLETITDSTREMMFRFLAQQVFVDLPEADRDFLLRTCLYPVVDIDVLTASGYDDAALTLGRLRRRVAIIADYGRKRFKYHDLFREFLEDHLKSASHSAFTTVARDTGLALEQQGRIKDAIFAFVRAEGTAVTHVQRILSAHAFDLLEHGDVDVVEAALAALPDKAREQGFVHGIRASIEWSLGDHKRAEASYRNAIASTPDLRQRVLLQQRFGRSLNGQHRAIDAIDVLEAAFSDLGEPAGADLLYWSVAGSLSNAYALAGKARQAIALITTVLEGVGGTLNDDALATAYHQASFVYYYCSNPTLSREFAQRALHLAATTGLARTATNALSVLHVIASDVDDDVPQSLWHLSQMEQSAARAGDMPARAMALVNMYELETERGAEQELSAIEFRLREVDFMQYRTAAEAFAPASAMRAAWSGDFAYAYRQLIGTAESMVTKDRRALRWSEIALYASQDGRRTEAERAISQALAALPAGSRGALDKRKARALLLCAIASTLIGKASSAHKLLQQVERADSSLPPRVRVIARVARAFYSFAVTGRVAAEMSDSLTDLEKHNLGGFAKLFAQLTLPVAEAPTGFSQLTPAEVEVLRILATGASTRDIAEQLGRSTLTVNTHIKAIVRKLECKGRRQATALAVKHGITR